MQTGATETKLTQSQWQRLADDYANEVSQWTVPFRQRRRKGKSHPVDDFLFVYYRYSSGQLEHWHPGANVRLECPGGVPNHFSDRHYRKESEIVFADPTLMDEKSFQRLRWTAELLRQTESRKGNFSCLGLHEWAMVYRGHEVRHEKTTPLRLPQAEIDAIVESRPLTCTHFDAFRFYAIDAKPLNRIEPTLESRPDLEQPGCIHANMDLYKWAFKAMPWIGSEFLLRCFRLALFAREIDMRASPYDLSSYGDYEPILIETAQGRAQYEQAQREVADRAAPLRSELADRIESLVALANR
ncbi:hypothetical protein [Mariniblastus fucicola]|nr:hypothetical protein [Mariniblastus fucicola]